MNRHMCEKYSCKKTFTFCKIRVTLLLNEGYNSIQGKQTKTYSFSCLGITICRFILHMSLPTYEISDKHNFSWRHLDIF